ncbi:kinetochore Sim4 complex subunit FTA2-domain-containing protein [Xylaria bambusicola]|uniref:kinetochore Sim4 complex subunit FTA2-domain-containing protein n=1 Tax=Xylaria bambusicola TaxID=326684 RepID=UPI00200876A1|nr:kinetochore Sim4 complex subunit FTA2-domain-containing protein [Xylaria bambusicola]KAI0515188.1 kinetochore Sim4 complex subunit FTA2-domain-containing protein [Xylaria bambusicola]
MMYPDWPECTADLVPLPQCPGPKLRPFDFQGHQKIEFLEILGEGLHAIVFKVRILDQIYALRVFRWIYDYNWLGFGEFINREKLGGLRAVYNYMEPFNADCRAFGRLQEAGCEELAIRCFGYVLLGEDNERAMMSQFDFNNWSFNVDIDETGYREEEEQRLLYPGKDALGETIDEDRGDVFPQGLARQLLRSVVKLQKLGIIEIDVAIRQMIDGKLGDFSSAITLPHFITNPELNPHLSPVMVRAITRQTFVHCMNDYLAFDSMIHSWNDEHDRRRLSIQAFPGGRGCSHKARYNLRGSRAIERTLYTFVDPRRYSWTSNGVIRRAKALPVSRGHATRSVCRRNSRHLLRKLTARPDVWHYQSEKEEEEWAKSVGSCTLPFPHVLDWDFKGGYLFPVKNSGKNIK